MRRLALMALLGLTGCATSPPITVTPIVNCPQPAALALSAPEPLPQVPALLGGDPSAVIGELSEVIAADARVYGDEAAKRAALIDHGARLCGWTR